MTAGDRPWHAFGTSEALQIFGIDATRGLTEVEARERADRYRYARLLRKRRTGDWALLAAQFRSPLVQILVAAAFLSLLLRDRLDAALILAMVSLSALLGFSQERRAARAVESLLAVVQVNATVLRDGLPREVPVEEVVPGDIVLVSAGDLVPADSRILESKDLFAGEAALTGETYPVEKAAGAVAADAPLARRTNSLFFGTHVVSGSARAVAVRVGTETEFGKISQRLKLRPPETEFERGARRFGYFLMEVTLLLVLAVFAINVYFSRPVIEALLFSLAIAVGITPEFLPAIISANLAHGARRMARAKVIVKRLVSIENFGSMTVLCSDKTGTLTEGVARVHGALDAEGRESERVLLHAYLNATYQTGFRNMMDEAIRAHRPFALAGYRKLDEIPYDFLRKRLSVLVGKDGRASIVTKGAFDNVLAICARAEIPGAEPVPLSTVQGQIRGRFEEFSSQGFRVLGVAYRDVGSRTSMDKSDEVDMTFLGFIVFTDPLQPGAGEALLHLKRLGITLKLVTGDNRRVATSVGERLGLPTSPVLTGVDLRAMSDDALRQQVNGVSVFAEIEPNQKERIILALRRAGHVVGHIGDGINDATALRAADVGISVQGAVDVAKEAADIVMLERDLGILAGAVEEGRRTFANTLKYIFMVTSANFGNMVSAAGASLFLPFLPLLPKQVLLVNLLTDIPEVTMPTDNIDAEWAEKPRRWDIGFIRRFMVVFGGVSSVFDFLTFGVLLLALDATTPQFRTGWFVESVASAALIALVVRTRRPFFRSRPSKYLAGATLAVVAATLLLPFASLIGPLGFEPLPLSFLGMMVAVVGLYILTAESVKRVFFHGAPGEGGLWRRK